MKKIFLCLMASLQVAFGSDFRVEPRVKVNFNVEGEDLLLIIDNGTEDDFLVVDPADFRSAHFYSIKILLSDGTKRSPGPIPLGLVNMLSTKKIHCKTGERTTLRIKKFLSKVNLSGINQKFSLFAVNVVCFIGDEDIFLVKSEDKP